MIIITEKEALILIDALKRIVEDFISLPENNKSKEYEAQSNNPNEKFKLTLYRGGIGNKKNIEARIARNNVRLLALHINPTNKHYNPDGEMILGSHWHAYKEGYDMKYAYPAEDIESKDFGEATIEFFRRFNIIDYPEISEQIRF